MTSFDWFLNLNVAEKLLEQQGEEFYRSSASRAYYGVFGAVRDALEQSSLNFPPARRGRRTRSEHSSVIGFLKSDRRFSTLGANLDRLRRSRELADYDANRQFIHDDAVKALEWARAIQSGISAIESA